MKISNSKKELARIISGNGGWRNGAEFAWYGNQTKKGWFGISKPRYSPKQKSLQVLRPHLAGSFPCRKPNNWHQTILSRDEYFHLYPAPDADVGSLSAALDLVTDENKHEHVDSKPTIGQLAADYCNRKDFAERKQQEADTAKADADAKLAELVAAGKALGLVLSVAAPEPELVITDWRDLQDGDVIEVTGSDNPGWVRLKGVESLVTRIGPYEDDVSFCPRNGGSDWTMSDNTEWRFIRRPAKGAANA